MATHEQQQWLLARYLKCRNNEHRNAVVAANLPLVWKVARRESERSGHSFEDLVQEGVSGLIKAVERFEPSRGNTLSTAAVPWIRGAMRHYLRDRCRVFSGARSVIELLQRGAALQRRRQLQGSSALDDSSLAQALGCSPQRWQEAQALQACLRIASLDQPGSGSDPETPLVEQLSDHQAAGQYSWLERCELRRQLWRGLKTLNASQRRLVLARVLQQRTWQELGAMVGVSARAAQRRYQQACALVRQQLVTAS
ncbi:sigma-70 family RNA polymerase sigma factor [Synechococcus sp. A10-1-5-1]|uniref:sigma-70 family RNA polymerase sigma factor n=1 Tax=Synechococcus sp. A10-1-5-1 TaxID=2936507 RepID=UPI002000C535|nr:sigma-70 family RNA polymerase sigma factor [Synechococcus sp. A10-1-5-1]UPM50723.1 sigma-70 family RNA polymerase sigma factor [Synechococcus sp. A10-1-5-1]